MRNDSETVGQSPATSSPTWIEFIKVLPDEIREYGVAPATVLAHLRFRNDPMATYPELADEIGLTRNQVHRAIEKLIDAGAISKTQPAHFDRTSVYEILIDPLDGRTCKSATREDSHDPVFAPSEGANSRLLPSKELEENQSSINEGSPDDMTEIAGQIGMLGDGIPTRAELSRTAAIGQAGFDQFWDRWPKKTGRKSPARRAWDKRMAEGFSIAELHLRLDRYLAAYNWWNEHHPDTPANLMHISTFLASKHLDFDEVASPRDNAEDRWGFLARKSTSDERFEQMVKNPENVIGTPEWSAKLRAERLAGELA